MLFRMMNFPKFSILLVFFFVVVVLPVVFASNRHDPNHLPRPLILDNFDTIEMKVGRGEREEEDDLWFHCQSWRFGVETNNVRSWKTVPVECADYVAGYMLKKGYAYDLRVVSEEARSYARGIQFPGDGKDLWIFDIDETLLSNLPYYVDHGFGLDVFDGSKFDEWVSLSSAPAINSSLKLYQEILLLGFKVFLLTGRNELQRNVTEENLRRSGFEGWNRLILRGEDDHGKPAAVYKSQRRSEIIKEGFRIVGNSGDQWSDLLGFSMANRSFKIPNPMYYID